MSTDTSWRDEYLTMKSGLNKTQIRLLKEGACSLSSIQHYFIELTNSFELKLPKAICSSFSNL